VKEALNRGVKRVFAGTRVALTNTDPRVTALTLDVTNASHIQRAADEVAALDVLINNAGVLSYDDLTDFHVIQKHLDVNLLGLLKVPQAFLPLLKRSKGAVVNNLSLASVAAVPVEPQLLDLEGGGAQPDTVPTGTPGASRGRRTWRDPRIH